MAEQPEFHEGHPVNPLIAMILATSDIMADTMVTDDLKPLSSQYELKVGCKAIMAGTNSTLDGDLTVLEVVDPENFAGNYPNWEERLMKSYLLCRWQSESDPEGGFGWFSRVKLIEVTDEHHAEVLSWIEKQERPDNAPDWLVETYDNYTRSLSEIAPTKVPKLAHCGVCESAKVVVVVKHIATFSSPAGEIQSENGTTAFVPIGEMSHDCESSGHLHCTECGSTRQMEQGELLISKDSDIARALGSTHGGH